MTCPLGTRFYTVVPSNYGNCFKPPTWNLEIWDGFLLFVNFPNHWLPYVYWTVHHLDSWIKIDNLDVICFIISLFTAQHVSNVSTSTFRSLRLIVDLFHVLYCSVSMCVGVKVWFGWGGVVSLCRLKHWCFSLHLLYYFTIYCSTRFEC